MFLVALIINLRFGFFKLFIGVGTAIIKTSVFSRSLSLFVKFNLFKFLTCDFLSSPVLSIFFSILEF